MCHPEQVRVLSIAEYAAIQEFPKGWAFHGTIQKQYQQAGNAVPVRLGAVAGSVLDQALSDSIDPDGQHCAEELPNFRRVYLRSHVRTRKWFKDGQVFSWGENESKRERYYQRPSDAEAV